MAKESGAKVTKKTLRRVIGEDASKMTIAEINQAMETAGRIFIDGYDVREVRIKGRAAELEDLADELKTWSPAGGWSEEAQQLFEALRGRD